MTDDLMKLCSQFALMYVAVWILSKAVPPKPVNPASLPYAAPTLRYDNYTV
jgi:hypothetical protein